MIFSGVDVSGGVKVVLNIVKRVFSERYVDGFLAMVTIYFPKSLNLVDRSTYLVHHLGSTRRRFGTISFRYCRIS